MRNTETAAPRDFVGIAKAYAAEAIADVAGDRFGKWIRLAAKRFVADLERAAAPGAPFTFDEAKAADACGFIEELPHVEGKWQTPTIVLHPSHIFFVVNLFGFRGLDGNRRFTTALFAVARKNAKSTLAAAILLYCLCCEDEPGPQVISAATTGSQARIVFNVARRMVEQTAALRQAFTLEPFANAVSRWDIGGTFKPINSKASTQDGLNPSHTALDEVHAHKTHDLLNVLQSAAGARAAPLFLFTTTEGYETPGPWPELRHFAQQVLQSVFVADHFFALYFALDDEHGKEGDADYRPADKDFDSTKWIKANPLMDVNPLLARELAKAAIDAKAMPGRHAEFKIKRLNRRAAAAESWIDLTKWNECAGAVDLKWLIGKPCYAGLDLASTKDLTAFRLVWRVDGMLYTYGRRWVPGAAVAQRTERGTVPYAGWVAAGLITQTEGDVVDYAVVEREIVELCEKYNPIEVAFDRWNATDICNRLIEQQIPMVEFIQGPKSYHPAMTALEVAYIGGNLRHGGDPVLTWCASNLVPRRDANLNMAPDKKRSAEKIDDFCALLMGVGRMVTSEPEQMPEIFTL